MEKIINALPSGTILRSSQFTYFIQQPLGQGSFGITYLATTQVRAKTVVKGSLGDIETDSIQTVKVTIKEFFMKETNSRSGDSATVEGTSGNLTKNYRKKFRKEAENLSHLNHPNIVKVSEVFDANNTTYYVMEYIDGMNLDEMIPTGKGLNETYAIGIIKDVAVALQYMHSKKMLHLDLKPKNIMVGNDGKVTLIDFGLSKQYDENGEPESSTSIGLGTPGYAPIEQANYHQDGTFPATLDVYALGATLYKMVVGRTAPEASDVFAYGLDIPDVVSKSTKSLILDAMRPKKTERIQSVAEFIRRMGMTTGSKKDNDSEKTENHTKWLVGMAAMLAIVFVGYMLLNGDEKKDEPIIEPDVVVNNLPKQVNNLYYESGLGVCSYSGPVDSNDKPHGTGKAVFTDGRLYQGSFNHGVLEGLNAHFEYKNGDIFNGEFRNNSFWKGKYIIKKDGSYFDGYFVNGKPDKGNWYDRNGNKI